MIEAALFAFMSAVFVAELTDKDALLVFALSTRMKASFVFAAGSLAFTITTAIIVMSSYVLVQIVPVFWIKLAGGIIMIAYGVWGLLKTNSQEEVEEEERKLLAKSRGKERWIAFLTVVSLLALLDLTGDATEILIIVFAAHFQDLLLVFASALTALIIATGFETFLGSRLRNFISVAKLRIFSFIVFLTVGCIIIITTIL